MHACNDVSNPLSHAITNTYGYARLFVKIVKTFFYHLGNDYCVYLLIAKSSLFKLVTCYSNRYTLKIRYNKKMQ